MARSVFTIFLATILTLCSAQNLNNYKIVTWNTAGPKWEYVRTIMNTGIQVLAIQEAGSISAINGQLRPVNTLLPFSLEHFPTGAAIFGVTEYVWNNGATNYYLYYYDNRRQGGSTVTKQNMAIVTKDRATEIILIPSEVSQNLPNAQAVNNQASARAFINRPALGVRIGNCLFFSIHPEPTQTRNEATALITSIRDYVERSNPNLSWFAMGDFNRNPDQLPLPAPSTGKVINKVRTRQNTRVSGELDYAVAGGPTNLVPNIRAQLVQFAGNPSDHTPVRFN